MLLPADSEHSAIFQCLQGTPWAESARLSTGVPTPGLRRNQLTASGFNNSKLVALNSSLILHCKKKNYKCIDVAINLDGTFDFWWDGIHTTPKGSQKIADIIAPKLIKIFNETN